MAGEDGDTAQAVTLGILGQMVKDIGGDVKEIKGQNQGFFAALGGLKGDVTEIKGRLVTVEKWQDQADRERLQRRGLVLQSWQAFGSIGVGLLGIAVAIYEVVVKATGKG